MKKSKKEMIRTFVPPEVAYKLRLRADLRSTSVSEIVRQLVIDGLEEKLEVRNGNE